MMRNLGLSESEPMVRADGQTAHHIDGEYPALSNPGSNEIAIGTRLFNHGKWAIVVIEKKYQISWKVF